jgi:hypothetical protein
MFLRKGKSHYHQEDIFYVLPRGKFLILTWRLFLSPTKKKVPNFHLELFLSPTERKVSISHMEVSSSFVPRESSTSTELFTVTVWLRQ